MASSRHSRMDLPWLARNAALSAAGDFQPQSWAIGVIACFGFLRKLFSQHRPFQKQGWKSAVANLQPV